MDSANNSRYKDEERQTGLLKGELNAEESWIYELELLQRITKRVVNLSPHCTECSSYKSKIADIYIYLADEPDMTIDKRRSYSVMLFNIATRLDVDPGLIIDRGKWWIPIIIGIVIGAMPGLTFALMMGTKEQDTGADIGRIIAAAGIIIGGIIGLISSNVLSRKMECTPFYLES